jgi:hypothetical protein
MMHLNGWHPGMMVLAALLVIPPTWGTGEAPEHKRCA